MTDKDTKSNASSDAGSSVVLVDKSHKSFRPTDLPDDGPVELHRKSSRPPAVPSIVTEKSKPSKVSSMRAASPEPISLANIEMDVQRTDLVPSLTQPIPATLDPATDVTGSKDLIEHEDSITVEITDMRPEESPHREWSDEEASGLPRSESRASRTSRVSRAVRQLFCCGVSYSQPSEHDVSSPRGGNFPGGI